MNKSRRKFKINEEIENACSNLIDDDELIEIFQEEKYTGTENLYYIAITGKAVSEWAPDEEKIDERMTNIFIVLYTYENINPSLNNNEALETLINFNRSNDPIRRFSIGTLLTFGEVIEKINKKNIDWVYEFVCKNNIYATFELFNEVVLERLLEYKKYPIYKNIAISVLIYLLLEEFDELFDIAFKIFYKHYNLINYDYDKVYIVEFFEIIFDHNKRLKYKKEYILDAINELKDKVKRLSSSLYAIDKIIKNKNLNDKNAFRDVYNYLSFYEDLAESDELINI